MVEYYIPPAVMIVLILLSIGKWVHAIIITRNLRGVSAITSRLYLLYAYIVISFTPDFTLEFKYLLLVLGVGAILLDESIFWAASLTSYLVKFLKNRTRN